MRVSVREYQKDNQKFEINFVNHEKKKLNKNWI
jgi:NADPH-dependent ferric siderophore reductase